MKEFEEIEKVKKEADRLMMNKLKEKLRKSGM